MSQPKSNEGHVAYSPEINAVRAVLVKYLNEYPADLLADLAQLLTEQKDEAAETAFKSAIKICELGNIKPPKSNEELIRSQTWYTHPDYPLEVFIPKKAFEEALAQKDAEVLEAIKHMVWCPQCGDALEQQGTNNDYSCFGCGDVHYKLIATQGIKAKD